MPSTTRVSMTIVANTGCRMLTLVIHIVSSPCEAASTALAVGSHRRRRVHGGIASQHRFHSRLDRIELGNDHLIATTQTVAHFDEALLRIAEPERDCGTSDGAILERKDVGST